MFPRGGNSLRDRLVNGDLKKGVISLAVPMALANAVQNVFALTDMFFVGRLGSVALAAVGMASVVNTAVITLMVGISTATRAMVSRYIGADDYEQAHSSAVASFILGFFAWVGLAISGFFLAKLVLYLMGATGSVLDLGTVYLKITMVGSISVIYLFIISSIFQGAGDAKTAMVITVFGAVLNIVLDPALIFGIWFFPRMGVAGAALATVLSRLLAAFVGFVILARGVNAFKLHLRHFRTQPDKIKRFFHIGVPGGGQTLIANLMGFIMMRLASGFGVAATAAYTIGIRLNMMALLPGFALGNAVATFVGQNLGAGKVERARKSVWFAIKIYEGYIIPLGILYFVAARPIISIFSSDPKVLDVGVKYLTIVPLSYPFYAVGGVIIRAVNGAGHTASAFVFHFAALYLVQLPLALILPRYLGVSGLWWALCAGLVAQGIFILPYFLSMKWATVGKWE